MDVEVELRVYDNDEINKIRISSPWNWKDKFVEMEIDDRIVKVSSKELKRAIEACQKADKYA